jgi:UDP-N-acetylglucosamine 2-epimerase
MKLSIIYGTRPEFLKLKILIDLLKKNNYPFNVIKIGQHKDFIEDNSYYNKFIEIETLSDDRISNIGANILTKLPQFIVDSKYILAQGDTATVFYSLLCGFQMKKKCIHLEAGMRTYDLENPFPEEGYRQMISRITDIHLCPSEYEKKYLESENIKGSIHVVGNTILDLVKNYNFPLLNNKEVLITLHRRENWDDFKEYIIEIIKLIIKNNDYTFYFITHPNPVFKEIINNLKEMIPINMIICEPMSHKNLIELLSKCSFVITDSGGIQEEANYLGKHIYILRKITERNAITTNKFTLCNIKSIQNIECKDYNHIQGFEYGNGESCEKIINILNLLY